MKTFYTLLGIFLSLLSQAQVDNRSETDCDGNSQSIYEVLELGKPLIIASKGLDCSTCMGQADNLADFANNQTNIQIWGAMYYLYGQGETADCASIDSWETSYEWDNIFVFPDLEEYWAGDFGAPTYTVIDPSSNEVVYTGSDFTDASNEALGLITVGLENEDQKSSFTLYSNNGILHVKIDSPANGKGKIEVINILGQKVYSKELILRSGNIELKTPFKENSGIYIANLEINGKTYSKKFLLQE